MPRMMMATLLASCGLQAIDIDAAAVQRGADAAVEAWAEALPIVERLDVFGYPCDVMPSQCRLPTFSKVEGCALWPGSDFKRARILVANDVDDIAEITTHEIGHLVFWGESHACDPHDEQCIEDHEGEP